MDEKKEQPFTTGLKVPVAVAATNKLTKTHKKRKASKVFFSVLVLIIVLVIAGFLINKYTSINLLGFTSKTASNVEYNAIFLSNGQVYFGVITKYDDHYTFLKDIYYLQASGSSGQVTPTDTNQQPKLLLVKLGNELHGPQDYMKINNSQIIFIENLKDDGKVVLAIKQYKTDQKVVPIK